MSSIEMVIRMFLMLVLCVVVIGLAYACAGPVDSAPGELDKLVFLPFVAKYPTSTPEPVPTVRPTPSAEPTEPCANF